MPSSFDAAATSYDDEFTHSEIGKRQRDRVFHWLEKSKVLDKTKHVFEVNCGTGYDAQLFYDQGLKVVATDASSEMIKVAKQKRSEEIEFYTLNFSDISIDDNVGNSDLPSVNLPSMRSNILNVIDKTIELIINMDNPEAK